jgi:FHA domain
MAVLTRLDAGPAKAEPIAIGERLSIGRGRENRLSIDEAAVSRRHARIVRQAQGYKIVDLGSENGTWVEGRRIQQHWLRTGERVRIGEARFRFAAEPGDPEPPSSYSPAVVAGMAAVVIGSGIVIVAVSVALWYYWPHAGARAVTPAARPDCYDVCFRRCRLRGDDRGGAWCDDAGCCTKACAPLRGVGDVSLTYRECEDLAQAPP